MCELKERCRRYAYSFYYMNNSNDSNFNSIPTCYDLVLSYGASPLILEKKIRIYCLKMPNKELNNLCPVLSGFGKINCEEYQKNIKDTERKQTT